MNKSIQKKLSATLLIASLLLLGVSVWRISALIVPASIFLYILFALGTTDHIRTGLGDARFWQGLVRKQGLIFVGLSFLITITDVIVVAIWTLEATPDAFYVIWNDVDIPLHLSLPLSAMILGIVAGRHYSIQTRSAAHGGDQSQEASYAAYELSRNWLHTPTARRYIWRGLALTGIIPLLLSVTIVTSGMFYRPQGLFYTWLDGTYIGKVEWVSNSILQFRVVNYIYSDCVGCSPTPFCDYEVDLTSRETKVIRCQQFDRITSSVVESEQPQRVPTRDDPLLSPDGMQVAYVVKQYDLYVRPRHGGLAIAQRVYKYHGSGFFGRYHWELAMALIYSLPAGVLLMAPWVYVNKRYSWVRRAFFVTSLWNLAFFIGSLTGTWWSPLYLHRYLWASIP